jgi:hypothetical protein
MSDTFSKVEVITGVARRRRFATDLKLAVVAETMQPDIPPFRAKRMNYLNFAHLVRRSKIPPPPVRRLPAVSDIPELTGQSHAHMPVFLDPDKL